MPASNAAGRTLEIEVQKILEKDGLHVMRGAKGSPFDLIAWKDASFVLCLLVRSSRTVAVNGLSDCVDPVINLMKNGEVPGRCEFWVKYPGLWKQYQILQGGLISIGESNDRVNTVSA